MAPTQNPSIMASSVVGATCEAESCPETIPSAMPQYRSISWPLVLPLCICATARGRDLRLDLFRGLGLWLIFLDHIPFNVLNWITIRNYGFSDAAEMFVFIPG
jgi:OpgC protein